MGIKKNSSKLRSIARSLRLGWFYTPSLCRGVLLQLVYECMPVARREKVSWNKLATRLQSWTHACTQRVVREERSSLLSHWIIVGALCSLVSASYGPKLREGLLMYILTTCWQVRMCADGDVHGTLLSVLCSVKILRGHQLCCIRYACVSFFFQSQCHYSPFFTGEEWRPLMLFVLGWLHPCKKH
jgi:hypothetical protein